MAIAFLACGGINSLEQITDPRDLNLKTREIIKFVRTHFNEKISYGSYDDIRRKDLKFLTIAEVVVQSKPSSATNDSTRGYNISPFYKELLNSYGDKLWEKETKKKLKNVTPLKLRLQRLRDIKKIEVELGLKKLSFSVGKHNDLQKAIIDDFLPRYGFGAEVLYVGDTSDKYLHLDTDKLEQLNFFELSHEELPDIVAYSKKKNWIYLIEAVHSSGPISEVRLIELQKLTNKCSADVVFVTAFLERATFRKFMADIAWETEVWIADNPDHLIHFNGDKFLGPYKKN